MVQSGKAAESIFTRARSHSAAPLAAACAVSILCASHAFSEKPVVGPADAQTQPAGSSPLDRLR
ncbi:MAG: hypothetical protein NTX64_16710, partial [Elusimicrobia bacterium]|nr:hypothetical protein [Elusimicrobiota bacterium]